MRLHRSFIDLALLRSHCGLKIVMVFFLGPFLRLLMGYFDGSRSRWDILMGLMGLDKLQIFVLHCSLGHREKRLFVLRKFMESIMLGLVKVNEFLFVLDEKQLCWRKSRFPYNFPLEILPGIKLHSVWCWSKSHYVRFLFTKFFGSDLYFLMSSRLYLCLFCFNFWQEIFL